MRICIEVLRVADGGKAERAQAVQQSPEKRGCVPPGDGVWAGKRHADDNAGAGGVRRELKICVNAGGTLTHAGDPIVTFFCAWRGFSIEAMSVIKNSDREKVRRIIELYPDESRLRVADGIRDALLNNAKKVRLDFDRKPMLTFATTNTEGDSAGNLDGQ